MKNNTASLIISSLALVIAVVSLFRPGMPEVESKVFPQQPETVPGVQVKTFDLPDTLYFLGERVPLEDPDVHERLDREIHVNTFFHSSTIFLLKRANRWLPQIRSVLDNYELPQDLEYLAVIESGLQNVISPSNAVGFWQFLRPTGKEFGLEINREVDQRYDPILSTHAAARYLIEAWDRFGNWTNVAASYNIGMNGLRRELEEQQVSSYYDLDTNDETARYVFRAMALKIILTNPEKFGYNIPAAHLYEPEQTREIVITATISDLAAWARQQGFNYKLLVRYNPWLRQNKLTVSGENSYIIKLPVNVNG